MRRILAALALFALLAPATAAQAKKKNKKSPPAAATVKKTADTDVKPVGDKRTNEGAQGRINSTEAAAQDADSPQFDHRP